ncbi:carbamate kinase [Rhizobium petrolearium]|uniref:carbamate kinase n=1 Tax=Neorhizobium petrolearium TaxID=515361 RepID=UPI001AE7AB31|nr:carbamate kinase [Neorhizobium petrolearium]MBP1842789.1 carbamate kinase [Neorhizobium petrolearium]
MLIVAALGGNALLRRGEPLTAENQRANVKRAAAPLAGLITAGHSLVITHGNGPQVGLLALETAGADGAGLPLDVLGAETEGMIGYMIEQELASILQGHRFGTLLTLVKVNADDPAFRKPTKFIGPVYPAETARTLAAERGWQVAPDGDKWRRVVASPAPQAIMEAEVISLLVKQGVTVICTGGGGIPVVERNDGSLQGIESVIDKDAASALLAEQLDADMLLLLTDVDAVYADFGTPNARPLARMDPADVKEDQFPAGSMRPKIRAATRFSRKIGRRAAIGRLEDASAIVAGEKGTVFTTASVRAPD